MCVSHAVCLDTTRMLSYFHTRRTKHCAENRACLRSLCGFILEKHRTSRKSAVYKEPSISANESCISTQEPCVPAQKKRRADTHID